MTVAFALLLKFQKTGNSYSEHGDVRLASINVFKVDASKA